MLRTIVLVCSLSTPPQDCTPATAIDTIQGGLVKNEIMCGLYGQSGIATTEIRPEAGKSYAKVVCRREREAEK